jgi:hypothetical protein
MNAVRIASKVVSHQMSQLALADIKAANEKLYTVADAAKHA